MRARRCMAVLLLAVAAVSPSYAADTVYARADVAKHALENDCWSIVRGVVYNLTEWVHQHPHGESDILGMCGKDGTEGFEGEHIGKEPVMNMLTPYKIGYLPEAVPTPTPTPSPSVMATPTATPSPSAKPAAKPARVTITCVKGKQVKKVAATKCPSGWKKK